MEDIRRYRLFTHDDGDGFPYTDNEIKKDGEWVKHSDHKAVVETMQNKIDELKKELNSYAILFKPYQPCNHRGCLSHLSHPCEGCGRIGGEGFVYTKGIK